MDPKLSRRSLLVAGAGLVVGAACSKNSKADITLGGKESDALHVAQASGQILSGPEPQRVAIGIFRGNAVLHAGRVTFAFGQDLKNFGPAMPGQLHSDGIPTRPYFVTHAAFPQPGQWIVKATVNGKETLGGLEVIDPTRTEVPLVGQPMIATPTPTPEDPKGINPICTATPVCPLHDVSLDAALAAHRPMAVLFATPAFCQSRTCGPVLDVLLTQRAAFADRVHFLHVESQPQATTYAPAFLAYHLDFEPILFLAGADGVVRQRLDGPYDKKELSDALNALVS